MQTITDHDCHSNSVSNYVVIEQLIKSAQGTLTERLPHHDITFCYLTSTNDSHSNHKFEYLLQVRLSYSPMNILIPLQLLSELSRRFYLSKLAYHTLQWIYLYLSNYYQNSPGASISPSKPIVLSNLARNWNTALSKFQSLSELSRRFYLSK